MSFDVTITISLLAIFSIVISIILFFYRQNILLQRIAHSHEAMAQGVSVSNEKMLINMNNQFEKTASLITQQHEEQTRRIVDPLTETAHGVRALVEEMKEERLARKVISK